MGASSAKLAKLQQIYEALDEDRDGELTIEELEVWAKDEVFLGNNAFAKRFASFSSVAEELDINRDGKVSLKVCDTSYCILFYWFFAF
jgi:Ca2+-binding EF-hand superfamily protein